jgi:hypothetical protein
MFTFSPFCFLLGGRSCYVLLCKCIVAILCWNKSLCRLCIAAFNGGMTYKPPAAPAPPASPSLPGAGGGPPPPPPPPPLAGRGNVATEPVFVNILGSPVIDSQPGGPVRQPYLSYWPARLDRLAESITRNRFLGSLNVYKYGLSVLSKTCRHR